MDSVTIANARRAEGPAGFTRAVTIMIASVAGCMSEALPGGPSVDASPRDAPIDRAIMERPPTLDLAATADLTECRAHCAMCAVGELCMGGAEQVGADRTRAACLRVCRTSTDCAPGLRCAILRTSRTYYDGPPVCTSDGAPAPCGSPGPGGCTDNAPVCLDDARIAIPFVSAVNYTCGSDVIVCPKGCERLAPDGGFGDPLGRCR